MMARLLILLWFIPASVLAAPDEANIFPQLGHTEPIGAVAISPDGRTIVSGSSDRTLKLWDVVSGRELRTLSGHTSVIAAVAFSPDGKAIVSASKDNTLKLWDFASGRELRTLKGHTHNVETVAFSGDGRTLVSGSPDDTIRLWDVATGRALRTIKTQSWVYAVALAPDGRTVLAGHSDRTLKLWDVASGLELRTLSSQWAASRSPLAFSRDGRSVVSVVSPDKENLTKDRSLKRWDVASGRELGARQGDWVDFSTLALSHDAGVVVAMAKKDLTLKLWDIGSGRERLTLSGSGFKDSADYSAFAFSPDGRMVVATKKDRTLTLWDASSGRKLRDFASYSHYIRRIAFSPDGRTVVSGDDNGILNFWNATSGRQLNSLTGHEGAVDALTFSADGRTLISASSKDFYVKHWDAANGRELRSIKNFDIFGTHIALAGDGRTLFTGGIIQPLKLWDVADGRETPALSGYTKYIHAVAFAPDGRTVASSHDDKLIKLWDVANGREVRTLTGHQYWAVYMALSTDGRTLASSDVDSNLKLWNVASGRELALNQGYDTPHAKALAFSPDGRTLASGHVDKTVKFWDVGSGRKQQTLRGHNGIVRALGYSPDGSTLASSGDDGTIRLWDTSASKEKISLLSFKGGEWIAITPEGYFDASAKGDQFLNVRIGNKVYGIDQYREKFYRPDLVQLAIAGKALPDMARIESVKPAPSVAIVDTPAAVSAEEVMVKLLVTDQGGGVGDVRLYLNGSAVVLEKTRTLQVALKPDSGQILSYTLRLVPGKNSLRAIAFNAANSMQSTDALHQIEARLAERRPSLHALVIGIQEYENPKLNLQYPVADAQLFAQTLQERAAGLFERVSIKTLTTRPETTISAITAALTSMKQQARPEDLFVFYVASHGTVDDGEYFLITSNVGATSTDKLKRDALSQNSLKELIANIPATKKLIVLDTCNAGKMGDSLQVAMLTRGMSEDTAMKVLSRAVGSTILSASTSVQEALEGYKGHGLFTYVLTEGLKGKADLDKDGYIKTKELGSYLEDEVPLLAEKVFKHRQYPVVNDSGQGFPVVRVR